MNREEATAAPIWLRRNRHSPPTDDWAVATRGGSEIRDEESPFLRREAADEEQGSKCAAPNFWLIANGGVVTVRPPQCAPWPQAARTAYARRG